MDTVNPTDGLITNMYDVIVFCRRCIEKRETTPVGWLDRDELARWRLSATDRFQPEDEDHARAFVPTMESSTHQPVDLWCPRCNRSRGQWKAVTIAMRAGGRRDLVV